MTAQTEFALPTRSDGSHQNSLAKFVTGDSHPQFMDDAHGFVAHGHSRFERILTIHDLDIGPADGRKPYMHHGFARTGFRNHLLFQPKMPRRAKDISFHHAVRKLSGFSIV